MNLGFCFCLHILIQVPNLTVHYRHRENAGTLGMEGRYIAVNSPTSPFKL